MSIPQSDRIRYGFFIYSTEKVRYTKVVDSISSFVPFNSLAKDNLYRAKKIDGKTYLFSDKGEMQTGLVKLATGDAAVAEGTAIPNIGFTANDSYKTMAWKDSGDHTDLNGGVKNNVLNTGIYYFRKDGATTAGQMVTGKTAVTDDDETNYYYFDSKKGGAALVNTVKDGTVYGPDGKRMQAENGNRNEIKEIKAAIKYGDITIPDGSHIVVTSSGKLRTKGSIVRIEGEKYKVDIKDGIWVVEPQ